jgi:hypothetical protein
MAGKGVSDLETCADYFALPGRSCERSIFQTFWKDDCVTKSLGFELETSNFVY